MTGVLNFRIIVDSLRTGEGTPERFRRSKDKETTAAGIKCKSPATATSTKRQNKRKRSAAATSATPAVTTATAPVAAIVEPPAKRQRLIPTCKDASVTSPVNTDTDAR
ncbi:hypothetical protein GGI21_000897 [Coemansia aciculifera]|nr:hypothetical protein GGI21_000897 [Coemansia aciculifera]